MDEPRTPDELMYVVGVSCPCRYINAATFIGQDLGDADGFLTPREGLEIAERRACALCGGDITVHWRVPTEEECALAEPWRDD